MSIEKIILNGLSGVENKLAAAEKQIAGMERTIEHHTDALKTLADGQRASELCMTETKLMFEQIKSRLDMSGENTQTFKVEMAAMKQHCAEQHIQKPDTIQSIKSLWPILFPLLAFLVWILSRGEINLFSGTD